ncbi:MAG: hypothetical protein LIR50_11680 [Bacillota bacterium]|nr:hypothetical protein [Bacillota bacterium]
MKIIKYLSERIEEELGDAEGYAEKALKYKEDWPEVADALWMISNEEMKHMQTLHGLVTKIIQDYRAKEGEPPEAMMAVYDYLHEKYIDCAKEVKILQEMYKNSGY